MTGPPPVARQIAAALERDPSRPLLTYYDQGSGERTELSGVSLGNWVSKTANLLSLDLGAGPGSTVTVALPPHWQTAALLLAAWSVGAAVTDRVPEGPADDHRILVCAEDRLMELADAPVDEVLVTSLDPMGRPVGARPPHVLDYSSEVRVHGDTFAATVADPRSPALYAGSLTLTYGSLAEVVTTTADRLGIRAGDRVLTSTAIADAGPVGWLLATICRGSSLVLVRADGALGPDDDAWTWLRHVSAQEQVTATLGVDLSSADVSQPDLRTGAGRGVGADDRPADIRGRGDASSPGPRRLGVDRG